MDLLKKQSTEILEQLSTMIHQLSAQEYQESITVLSNNSIGKHVRHILEFYEILLSGTELKKLNYDLRKRNPIIEVDKHATIEKIEEFKGIISKITGDTTLSLSANYSTSEENHNFTVPSSLSRELMYNIEHAIHHMAIIKIAVNTSFNHIKLQSNFGIASSTVRYNNQYETSD